jgi:hypothetical protein
VDYISAVSDVLKPESFLVTTIENELKKPAPFLLDYLWETLSQVPRPAVHRRTTIVIRDI